MPNTLVHFAAQGALSHALWRRLDPRFVYLGCLLPDLPWILRRAVVGFGLPVDTFELRLYTMGLASLAITLLLAGAVAVATAAPRLIFAVLGLNALVHLLLDATEVKFGNGVHLMAPASWRMTSFDWIAGESPVYLVLTLGGALLVAWEIVRPRGLAIRFELRPRRIAVAGALLAAYLLAPLPFLRAIEASDSYSVKTLRETDARRGRSVSLDRTAFFATPAGGFVELWTGERVRVTGSLPVHDAIVSLQGSFLEPDLLRVDRLVEHRRNRDWPSYLGLVLLALVFTRDTWGRRLPSQKLALALVGLGALGAPAAAATPKPPQRRAFSVAEASIPELQAALAERRVTSRELVLQYLSRIALYEDRLNAVMVVSPDALRQADELDGERAAGRLRGPLHGIPIALKDNIHTTDMPTTGGALAFDGLVPPYEATLTRNLREGGAIVLAKTVMTELANWVAGAPSPMPANYSALAGYGFNPYDPRRDPREATFDGRPALGTGGSSSGIGTAASFWAASVGTETSGSILSPSNQNMLVGIKPTLGRVSRYGVIPITADQDTPGPMARSVRDAAILLGVLEGEEPDANDEATKTCVPPAGRDYTRLLVPGVLKGARIGIPRAFYYDKLTPPGAKEPRGGLNPDQAKLMADAIQLLREQGATVVDPADIPSVVDPDPSRNILLWGICGGADDAKGQDADCSVVFKYGMKRDFNKWLASLGERAPLRTLAELRRFNIEHQKAGAIKYGQSLLDISDEMDVVADRARYEADRARDQALAGTHGIEEVIKARELDALLFPGSSGASIAARPGYPTVIVPFGLVPNAPTPAFPETFEAKPAPYGVSFTGLSCSEPRLLALAHAFEQATKRRVPPPFAP